ncbi:histidine kinase dimerization/phospho-acceptor domain-containing protein [Nodosilinea nodulosa]|uniref:histidine kinase dimerization/phospho-acceptor domain-containing protein n=1 Tax=Nodosilinea nodulosa TaxID=416001 RepID=UPI0002EE880D|nr:histidine kinase dimerization/phospho-acceptor domain-containing protein [Nodosilinea nodulosa]
MALPPLDHFLSLVPAYGLVTPLGEIARALGQSEGTDRGRRTAIAPSHIIVVDDEQRPLGALALGQLWASYQALHGRVPGEERAELRLFDCQPWLGPVVEVPSSQILQASTLAHLGRLTQEAPARPLVAVDSDGQYLGVLDPVRILGWLALNIRSDAPAAPDSEPEGGGQRAWVLELSHALKTPMTTLLGLSTLLLDRRIGSLSDRQFRYVSLMQQAIRNLTTLINLLLDWMRLESGQISPSLERVYLQSLTQELVPNFLSLQPKGGGAVTWDAEFAVCLATAEGWVQADPLRLRQSLHHILGYLISHGATPGGILVEPWGSWLGLTLWSSTAMVNPGSPLGAAVPSPPEPDSLEGLGLTLARRFSQLQGGELSGLSTPVWGSRITLLLPAPPTADSGSKTVLVLLGSASETVIEQVYGILRGSPYRLAVAPCCRVMVAMQARLAPSCTLIDWESLAAAPAEAAARLSLVKRLKMPGVVFLKTASDRPERPLPPTATAGVPKTLVIETLPQSLRPTLDQVCLEPLSVAQGGTMLLLRSPEVDAVLPQPVQTCLQRYRCRLLQVDDLPQANLLSRVWQPQAIILDRALPAAIADLQALAAQPDLARLPVVTLVPPDDWDAALALGLLLVPCPEALTQPPTQAALSLMQAIALACPTLGD